MYVHDDNVYSMNYTAVCHFPVIVTEVLVICK